MSKVILAILGIVSMVYGILVLMVGSGSKFWMVWEAIGVCFFLWAFMLHIDFFASHKTFSIIFHSAVLVGIAALSILCGLIVKNFSAAGSKNLDYIIVLGAQVHEHGPSVVLKYRLDTAIAYLEKNNDTICVLSGGKGANEPFSEAEGMANYLLEHGIEEDRIILEDQSKNTAENIRNSKELLEDSYRGVGIVTNDFHMFRALELAKMQGLEGACGIAADSNPLYLPNNVLRECFGVVKDWIVQGA